MEFFPEECRKTRYTLADDGTERQLPGEEEISQANKHLNGCEDCQEAMEDFNRLGEMFSNQQPRQWWQFWK